MLAPCINTHIMNVFEALTTAFIITACTRVTRHSRGSSHALGTSKPKIDCKRSCSPRMRFLLRAIHEITEEKRGIASAVGNRGVTTDTVIDKHR